MSNEIPLFSAFGVDVPDTSESDSTKAEGDSTKAEVRALLELALSHHEAKRMREAYATFALAIEKFPDQALSYLSLGIILLSDGCLVDAFWYLEHIAKKEEGIEKSQRVAALQIQATIRIRSKRLQLAQELLERAIELAPSNPKLKANLNLTLANVLVGDKKYEEAIEKYDLALSLFEKPMDIEARRGKAIAYVHMELHSKALEEWESLAENYLDDPNRDTNLLGGARACLELEKISDAKQWYRLVTNQTSEPARLFYAELLQKKALNVPDGDPLARKVLFLQAGKEYRQLISDAEGVTYNVCRALKGISQLKELLSHIAAEKELDHPGNAADTMAQAGFHYIRLSEWHEATDCFDWILERDEKHVPALMGKAEVLLVKKAYEEAEQTLTTLQAIQGDTAWILASLAQIKINSTDWNDLNVDQVLETYSRALELIPEEQNSEWILVGRAQVLIRNREYERAGDDLRSALIRDPKYIGALLALGTVYRNLQLYDEAIDRFEDVLRLDPNNIEALLRRANTYRMINNFQLAKQDLERVLLFEPDYEAAQQAEGFLLRSQKQYAEAVTAFEKHLGQPKRNTHRDHLIYLRLSEALLFKGDYKKALQYIDSAESSTWALYVRALIHKKNTDQKEYKCYIAKAIDSVKEEVKRYPTRVRHQFNLALFNLVDNRIDEAEFIYATLLEQTHSKYALEEALQDLENCSQLFPKSNIDEYIQRLKAQSLSK